MFESIKTKLADLGLKPEEADQMVSRIALNTLANLVEKINDHISKQPEPKTKTDYLIQLIQRIQLTHITNEMGNLIPSPNGHYTTPFAPILPETFAVQTASAKIEDHAAKISAYLRQAEQAAEILIELNKMKSPIPVEPSVCVNKP